MLRIVGPDSCRKPSAMARTAESEQSSAKPGPQASMPGAERTTLMGAAHPQTPRRSPRQAFGELRINATRWPTNEKQNTNELAELQL